jgi:hypothetical protein
MEKSHQIALGAQWAKNAMVVVTAPGCQFWLTSIRIPHTNHIRNQYFKNYFRKMQVIGPDWWRSGLGPIISGNNIFKLFLLKGQCHEIFDPRFFFYQTIPLGP